MNLNGIDVNGFDYLQFWVKGNESKGYARSFKVLVKRPFKDCNGVPESGSYIVNDVTDQWKRVRVPLYRMNGITDWTDLKALIISFHSRRTSPTQGGYFFDDIALIKAGRPGPSIWDKVIPAKKRAWEAALGGKEASKSHVKARLGGWPTTLILPGNQLPADDHEFLLRLARDTWTGLDVFTDREHGLPLDTIKFNENSVESSKAYIGDYTNVTDIAMYLLSVVTAFNLEFISKQNALERLDRSLTTLARLETFNGFFFNYYDTTSLERTSNFISFIDSAWLTAGLMVVRTAFPEFYERSSRLINQADFGWLYDDVKQLMSHGYYVNLQHPSEYHYGLLYTESRLGSLIAIGKGDVPEKHWFKMMRTLPAKYYWQSLLPSGRKPKLIRGIKLKGGYYQWRDYKFVPSWGGSLFEALMPTLVVDEQNYASQSLGRNDNVHATIHRRYALEELNYPVWGMSPSSAVAIDGYAEYGIKFLGARGYKCGVVTPHASALALMESPKEASSNLQKLAKHYDIYGEYGFYDAVDPITGKVAYKYLSLDQGMLLVSLANYLKNHVIQKYFAQDPIAARALRIIGDEHFFD
jgi:hypothetical protein